MFPKSILRNYCESVTAETSSRASEGHQERLVDLLSVLLRQILRVFVLSSLFYSPLEIRTDIPSFFWMFPHPDKGHEGSGKKEQLLVFLQLGELSPCMTRSGSVSTSMGLSVGLEMDRVNFTCSNMVPGDVEHSPRHPRQARDCPGTHRTSCWRSGGVQNGSRTSTAASNTYMRAAGSCPADQGTQNPPRNETGEGTLH